MIAHLTELVPVLQAYVRLLLTCRVTRSQDACSGHPCNMKEFKIYIGLTEDNMTEVLHTSLKDDSLPEAFSIRSMNHSGISLPTRFVKIEPLSYGLRNCIVYPNSSVLTEPMVRTSTRPYGT